MQFQRAVVVLQAWLLVSAFQTFTVPADRIHSTQLDREQKEVEEIPQIQNSEFLNSYFGALESDIRGIEDPLLRDQDLRDLLNANALQTIPGMVTTGTVYPLLNNTEDPITRISLVSSFRALNRDLNFSSQMTASGSRIDLEIGDQIPWEELTEVCPLVLITLEYASGSLEAAFIGAIRCYTGIHTGNSADGGDDLSDEIGQDELQSLTELPLIMSAEDGPQVAAGCGVIKAHSGVPATTLSLLALIFLTLGFLRARKRETAGY